MSPPFTGNKRTIHEAFRVVNNSTKGYRSGGALKDFSRNGSTGSKGGARSRTFGRSRGGPYSALIQGSRHTHPVYPRPEVRFVDETQVGNLADPVTPPALTAINNTGQVFCVNDLTNAAAGTSSAFTGYKVMTKSASYKYQVRLATTTPTPTSGRVVLIWDKQPNATGVAATWAQIFAGNFYLAFMNLQNVNRFTILRNDQFSLSPNGDQDLMFQGHIKINMESIYTTTNNVDVIPVTGALLIAFISDQSVAGQQPTLQGIIRTRYIDN